MSDKYHLLSPSVDLNSFREVWKVVKKIPKEPKQRIKGRLAKIVSVNPSFQDELKELLLLRCRKEQILPITEKKSIRAIEVFYSQNKSLDVPLSMISRKYLDANLIENEDIHPFIRSRILRCIAVYCKFYPARLMNLDSFALLSNHLKKQDRITQIERSFEYIPSLPRQFLSDLLTVSVAEDSLTEINGEHHRANLFITTILSKHLCQNRLFLFISFFTGLRSSDIVNLANNSLKMDDLIENGECMIKQYKTRIAHRVYAHEFFIEILKLYRDKASEIYYSRRKIIRPSMFCYKPYHPKFKLSESLTLTYTYLRKTFSTGLLMTSLDESSIGVALGHAPKTVAGSYYIDNSFNSAVGSNVKQMFDLIVGNRENGAENGAVMPDNGGIGVQIDDSAWKKLEKMKSNS